MSEQPIIYIPDASYDNPDYYPGLEENEAHERFISEVSEEFQLPAKGANIGAGADWPAVAIEIIQYVKDKDYILIGIALFFSGKKINENIEAWLLIGKKLEDAISGGRAVINRCAALLVGLRKYHLKSKTDLNEIRLLQYEALDGREIRKLEEVKIDRVSSIKENVLEENLGYTIHYFRILINGSELEMLIMNDILLEIKKRS